MTKFTQADYRKLEAEIEALGLDLWDENCDAENSTHEVYGSDAFWGAMYQSATMAAGQRAEDQGLNINKLLGRVVY
jgi:hypothetical protein